MSIAIHDVDLHFAVPEGSADARAHRVAAISDQTGPQASQARTRPPQMADLAQARLLADLLEAELVELEQAWDTRHRWHRHDASSEGDDHQLPEPLVRHYQELSEVRCLLAALHTRFPALADQAITGLHTRSSWR